MTVINNSLNIRHSSHPHTHLRSNSDLQISQLRKSALISKSIIGPSLGLSLRSQSSTEIPVYLPTFVNEAKLGIINHPPELCQDGTGGTYFMKNTVNKTVAVFKPQDECPLSNLNPKLNNSDAPMHFKGILPGEGASREIFAYQVNSNFFNVPETYMADIAHSVFNGGPTRSKTSIKQKRGSLQQFIPDMESAEDIGSSNFSLEDVQKIALLDLLLVNCDRNGGNILVHPESYNLVPIDHSFSLPDYLHLKDLQWYEWMNYRQSRQPLTEKISLFVKNLNIQTWVEKAKDLFIRPECILTMELAAILVTQGVAAGKTLFDIAKIMCSPSPHNTSLFCQFVEEIQTKASTHDEIRDAFAAIVSSYFSQ